MELVEYNCPNCTATLHIDAEKSEAVCEYCGSRFQIEDKKRDAEREGYAYELGRMKARRDISREQANNTQPVYYQSEPSKKRMTWLWVLGWIFFFPIPLTVLIVRSSRISTPVKIVLLAVVWGFVFYAGITGNSDTGNTVHIIRSLFV